jgi:ABC-type dipeptide/oligopeptide/nickel transport system ATPase subunit
VGDKPYLTRLAKLSLGCGDATTVAITGRSGGGKKGLALAAILITPGSPILNRVAKKPNDLIVIIIIRYRFIMSIIQFIDDLV